VAFVNCESDFNATAFQVNHGIGKIFERITMLSGVMDSETFVKDNKIRYFSIYRLIFSVVLLLPFASFTV
jgi:undecaprenyl pyrophosphate phosphatase UppP